MELPVWAVLCKGTLPETPPPDWGLKGAQQGFPQDGLLPDITGVRLQRGLTLAFDTL